MCSLFDVRSILLYVLVVHSVCIYSLYEMNTSHTFNSLHTEINYAGMPKVEILFAIQFKRSVLETLDRASDLICVDSVASFPVPLPAFHCLQYGKAGRAWYISSRKLDVIDK